MRTVKTFLIGIAVLVALALVWPVLTARAATQLNYAQAVRGSLSPSHTSDEYTFNGKTGDKLTIVMNALEGDLDPLLNLYDPQGRLIGENTNGGGKDGARMSGIVLSADGTYKIVAKNNAQGTSGNYSLVVSQETAKGAPINYEGIETKESYQLSRPWSKTNLTYRIANNLQNFNPQDVRAIVQQAWQAWSSVVPLTFREVQSGNADIVIQFGSIDGALNVLGQACPPSSPCAGQVEFDADETWILGAPRSTNDISFLAVATHEFGHIIGLLHSNDATALMYPSYSPYNLKPNTDDIQGAQRLYGAGRGGVPTVPPGTGGNTGGQSGSGQPQVQGTINNNQFANFWDFDVDAGETITVTMKRSSGNLDSFIVLLDANNHILAYDDDSAGNKDAVLRNIRVPQRGTYTVAATRYKQAQGYSQGNYTLTIDYGQTSAPPAAPTTANQPRGTASVQVSAGQAASLQQNPSLDSVLDTQFNESVSPDKQTRNATVQSNQNYNWVTTWCANNAQTLSQNLANITMTFAVNGTPVNSQTVTRTQPHNAENGLSCVDYFVVLSNWQPGQVVLTKTMTLRAPTYDGMTVYAPGDYVYEYVVNVTSGF